MGYNLWAHSPKLTIYSCKMTTTAGNLKSHFISRGWVGAGKRNLKKNWHEKNSIEPTCLHTTMGVAFTFKLDFSWLKHLDCI